MPPVEKDCKALGSLLTFKIMSSFASIHRRREGHVSSLTRLATRRGLPWEEPTPTHLAQRARLLVTSRLSPTSTVFTLLSSSPALIRPHRPTQSQRHHAAETGTGPLAP